MMDGLAHVLHLAFSGSGKSLFLSLLPRKRDFRQLVSNLKFYLGMRKAKAPDYPFGYVEKTEYWALVWGGVIMTLTGLVLWYKSLFLSFLPKWSMDVATAIHFYEAVLATLAILIWHSYAVIFKPGIYPMNWAWLTGTRSIQEAEANSECQEPAESQGENEPQSP